MATDWGPRRAMRTPTGYQATTWERDLSRGATGWCARSTTESSYDQFITITWQFAGDLSPGHRRTDPCHGLQSPAPADQRGRWASRRSFETSMSRTACTPPAQRFWADPGMFPLPSTTSTTRSASGIYSLAAFLNNIDESGLYSHSHCGDAPPRRCRAGKGTPRLGIVAVTAELLLPRRLAASGTEAATRFEVRKKSPRPGRWHRCIPWPLSAGFLRERDAGLAQHEPGVAFGESHGGSRSAWCGSIPVAIMASRFRRWASFTGRIRSPSTCGSSEPESQSRAVVLHYSGPGPIPGSRGYELVLDQGGRSWLIHFWPGNALAVRAKGSRSGRVDAPHCDLRWLGSRAAGVQLYRDGWPLDVEVVRDHPTRDILHRSQWGWRSGGI